MTRILKGVLLAVAIWIGVEVAMVVREVRARAVELQPILSGDRNSLKTVVENANEASVQMYLASEQAMYASIEQRQALKKTMEQVNELLPVAKEAVQQAKDTLQHLDENVSGNDGLLRAATTLIKNQDERAGKVLDETASAIKQAAGDLHDTTVRLEPTMKSLAEAMEGVSKVVNDPKIDSTLVSVDGMAKDGKKITGHVEVAMRPVKIWIKAIQEAWSKTWQIFTAW